MILTLLRLGGVFLKVGFIFFGGGYVLMPLLRQVTIDHYHWMTQSEFLDGVALSQLTPGPLAMLATFAGFRVGGFSGALVATVCIFTPCTILMLAISRNYQRLRDVEPIKAILDGLLPAVLGLVAATAYTLGRDSLTGLRDFAILTGGFLLLRYTRISPMVAILGAGCLGFVFNFS